jgi:glyoxylase I family protein
MSDAITFNHVSIMVSDTVQSVEFYGRILGLTVDPARPDLKVRGAWLSVGKQQLHLLEVPANPGVRNNAGYGGRDYHFALNVPDLGKVKQALDENGIDYDVSSSGRAAVFFRDPDGNGVEVIEGAPAADI